MAKILLALLAAMTLLVAPAVADEDPAEDEAVGPAYEPLDHGEEDQDSPGVGAGLVVLALADLVLRRRR